MRSSLLLPSSVFKYPVPGLSDFGNILVSVRMNLLMQRRVASAEANPLKVLEDSYDVFASILALERKLTSTLVEVVLPALAAEASHYGFLHSRGEQNPAQALEQMQALLRVPIQRWRQHIAKGEISTQPSKEYDPAHPFREPDERTKREQAIRTLKAECLKKYDRRISDQHLAQVLGWSDRTPVMRFKSCDPRNTEGVNQKIWNFLTRPNRAELVCQKILQ